MAMEAGSADTIYGNAGYGTAESGARRSSVRSRRCPGHRRHPASYRYECHGLPCAGSTLVAGCYAAEALRNVFQHSRATQVEVELCYDAREFRLRVRDDGQGIDPQILAGGGREGHFGLRGMRERAKLAGGKLTLWSAPDSGTEVELLIPGSAAYAPSRSATE